MSSENKSKSENILSKLFSAKNILLALLPSILLLGILRDPIVLGDEGILIGAIMIPVFIYLAGVLRGKFGFLKTFIFGWVGVIILSLIIVMTLAKFANVGDRPGTRNISEWESSPYYEECLLIATDYHERNDGGLFKDETSTNVSKQSAQILINCIKEKESF